MTILAGSIDITLLYPAGLKARRKVLSSIKQKLKNRGVSAIDSSGDRADEGLIEFCMALHSEADARIWAEKIEKLLEQEAFEYRFDLDWEMI